MAAATRRARRFLSVARAGARRIARERMRMVRSDRACCSGPASRRVEGRRRWRRAPSHDAADRFDRADMQLYAAVARRRIGALQHDEQGRELQRRADEWMAEQNIKNPVGMTRMLAPGFPEV